MALSEQERDARATAVLDLLSRNLDQLHRFLEQTVRFCAHQPPWPTGPLTTISDVSAARDAVGAYAAQLTALHDEGGCACHHDAPRYHHGWAARLWLDLSGHALDYANGRPWITWDQLIEDERSIRRHIDYWSIPPTDPAPS
jgi:hypothetical protein